MMKLLEILQIVLNVKIPVTLRKTPEVSAESHGRTNQDSKPLNPVLSLAISPRRDKTVNR